MRKFTNGWRALVQLGGLLFIASNAYGLVPRSPTAISGPSGFIHVTPSTLHSVTVRWSQSSITRVGIDAIPTHFVVCVRAANVVCTWPAGPQTGVFTSPVNGAAITRTPMYSNNPFGPRIVIGTTYAMTISLGDASFDSQLRYSVSACAAVAPNSLPTPASCASANGPDVWFVSKDLTAEAHMHIQQGALFVVGQAANIGTSRTGPFWSTIRTNRAMLNRSGRCTTDPFEVSTGGFINRDSLEAVTRDGQLIRVGDYKRGNVYDFGALQIVAIVPPLNFLDWADASALVTLEPSGTTANLQAIVNMELPIADFQVDLTSPYGVVTYTRVDTNSQITETNEANNGWGECDVFYP